VDESVKIYKDLKKKNKMISIPDIFIASTAISNQIPIATLNQKHFVRVRGLKFIDLKSL
jgi:tRNA(fMet)-specific endonuclease VapC